MYKIMKKTYQIPESLTVALNVKCPILDPSQTTTPIGEGEVDPGSPNLTKSNNSWDDEDWD